MNGTKTVRPIPIGQGACQFGSINQCLRVIVLTVLVCVCVLSVFMCLHARARGCVFQGLGVEANSTATYSAKNCIHRNNSDKLQMTNHSRD